MEKQSKAIILLSGGIDSAVAGALYRDEYELIALTIEYGQPVAEKEAAISMQDWLGCRKILCRIPSFSASREPSHYFPLRNLLFLSLAAHHGERLGASAIIIGANKDDFTDYPDCRKDFYRAFERAATKGSFTPFLVLCPLINRTKAQVVKKAVELGVPLDRTLSCYRPRDYTPCGECNACKLRAAALRDNGLDCAPTRLNVKREHFKSADDSVQLEKASLRAANATSMR